MGRILLYCATVFTSAFLLFQVQPVVGKYILPWFGSTPGVWTTCMLFFQVLLLGGYAYAHLLVSRLTGRRQALVHGSLLVLALLALPITPNEDLVPADAEAPVGGILLVLAASVGVPYLLLSATGPLLQAWFARLHPGRSPYRLYALSNVGSLLALLSYPFHVEQVWGLDQQTLYWSLGFALFALLCGACARTLWVGRIDPVPDRDGIPSLEVDDVPVENPAEDPAEETTAPGVEGRPTIGLVLLWFGLAATGSSLLLATTNQMCLDIAVVPFLWIVPLALYLISFILTFDHARWYARPFWLALLPLVLWHAYALLGGGVDVPLSHQVVGYALALFVGCMACHGELARSKPAPEHLTFFFLIVSIGGAAGGLLVALVAPAVFDDFHEFPILLCATFGVVLIAALRNLATERDPSVEERAPGWRGRTVAHVVLACAVLVVVLFAATRMIDPASWGYDKSARVKGQASAWFGAMRGWMWLPAVIVPLIAEQQRMLRRVPFRRWWGSIRVNAFVAMGIVASLGLVGMIAAAGWTMRKPTATVIAKGRNFYGTLAIKEYYRNTSDWDWTLRHGRIMHGFQLKKRPMWPTSYYGPESGVGLAIRFHPERKNPRRAFRIGVVGLGGGTVAAYANARLDPSVRRSRYDEYAVENRRDPGDVVRYYEINPMVTDWAWNHFTFLGDARRRGADVDVFLGDARLVMERQLRRGEAQRFDVLAVDAFSSDAIPIHLLTRECFDTYWKHLADDGALAIHITNRFIELRPIVRRLAMEAGKELVYIENFGDEDMGVDSSDWVVITNNEPLLRELRLARDYEDADDPGSQPAETAWTDDYSSVWPYVAMKLAKDRDEETRDDWRLVVDRMGLGDLFPEDDLDAGEGDPGDGSGDGD